MRIKMKPNSYYITEEDKALIREYYKLGMTIRQLRVMFKVSNTRIIKIINEKNEVEECIDKIN